MGVGWVGASFSYTSILQSGVLLFRESKLRFGWSEQREIDTFTIQEPNRCGMKIIISWLNNTCRFIHFILNDSCWNPYAICTSKSIKWFIKWSRKLGCNDQWLGHKSQIEGPLTDVPKFFPWWIPTCPIYFPTFPMYFPTCPIYFPTSPHIYIK
jgi:hypothetical protein